MQLAAAGILIAGMEAACARGNSYLSGNNTSHSNGGSAVGNPIDNGGTPIKQF
jgi:hypothetical protein